MPFDYKRFIKDASRKLIKQGVPAYFQGGCYYRIVKNKKVLKCAIGQNITKKEYQSCFEGSVDCLLGKNPNIFSRYGDEPRAHILEDIQKSMHDDIRHNKNFVSGVKKATKLLLKRYGKVT